MCNDKQTPNGQKKGFWSQSWQAYWHAYPDCPYCTQRQRMTNLAYLLFVVSSIIAAAWLLDNFQSQIATDCCVNLKTCVDFVKNSDITYNDNETQMQLFQPIDKESKNNC